MKPNSWHLNVHFQVYRVHLELEGLVDQEKEERWVGQVLRESEELQALKDLQVSANTVTWEERWNTSRGCNEPDKTTRDLSNMLALWKPISLQFNLAGSVMVLLHTI